MTGRVGINEWFGFTEKPDAIKEMYDLNMSTTWNGKSVVNDSSTVELVQVVLEMAGNEGLITKNKQ